MTNNYTANQNAINKVIKANITSITNGQPNAIHISKLFFPIFFFFFQGDLNTKQKKKNCPKPPHI